MRSFKRVHHSGIGTIVSQYADGWKYSDQFQNRSNLCQLPAIWLTLSTWLKILQTAKFFTAVQIGNSRALDQSPVEPVGSR